MKSQGKQQVVAAWVANGLTSSRIVLAVLFLVFFCDKDFWPEIDAKGSFMMASVAFLFFMIALITDLVDGKVARKYKVTSVFGQLMDPIADKVLVSAGLIALVGHPDTPFVKAWAVVVIIAREFLVTGLRLLAAAYGKVLAAERLGKHKTGWQMGYIVVVLGMVVVKRGSALFPNPVLENAWMLVEAMAGMGMLVVIGVTWLSGLRYLGKNWELIRGL